MFLDEPVPQNVLMICVAVACTVVVLAIICCVLCIKCRSKQSKLFYLVLNHIGSVMVSVPVSGVAVRGFNREPCRI